MKFSIYTVSMPEYDLESTVRLVKRLGYDGIEWRIADSTPAVRPAHYAFENRYWSYNLSTLGLSSLEGDVEKAAGLCREENLEICSLTSSTSIFDTETCERILKASADAGCPKVRLSVPGYDETVHYRTLFEKARDQAQKIEALAKRHGVQVNYETHMGNIIPSASAAYRFVEGMDPRYTGIIFDPGNMVFEGFENYKLGLELLGEYLGHVHVKNAAWYFKDEDGTGAQKWQPGWAPFTKGYAALGKLLQHLKEMDYNGFVSVEDFSNEQDTLTKIKENIEFLWKLV